MKSIVEEASSIFKAIEKAWERAGKPVDFSVKIFEDSQKSFFGLTKKQAKIGLFFTESAATSENKEDRKPKKIEKQEEKTIEGYSHKASGHKNAEKRPVHSRKPQGSEGSSDKSLHQMQPYAERHKKPAQEWSDEIINTVRTWVKDIVQKSNLVASPFTIEQRGNRLQITFAQPLVDDIEKNTDIFRSLSYVLLGMIRSHFKKEFRFLKVVLTTQGQTHNDASAT
ncbi:MAG TPA: hypothetical protein VGW78_00160 [Candidatus Babeliales bacterium]|jgi:predicted RNA-binding protein Jag|nr:hypothetical protein [Candidatus Babeliales bacterium]